MKQIETVRLLKAALEDTYGWDATQGTFSYGSLVIDMVDKALRVRLTDERYADLCGLSELPEDLRDELMQLYALHRSGGYAALKMLNDVVERRKCPRCYGCK